MAKKEGSTVSSVEFAPDVYEIIQATMIEKEMSLGAAVRYLIKQGANRKSGSAA